MVGHPKGNIRQGFLNLGGYCLSEPFSRFLTALEKAAEGWKGALPFRAED